MLLITDCFTNKPGIISLRGETNRRQPWAPTPRIEIDAHTICWVQLDAPTGRRITPTKITLPDGDEATTDEGYVVPFTVGTSFGVIQFVVPVTAVVRGEFVPINTDLISELLHQFNGVL